MYATAALLVFECVSASLLRRQGRDVRRPSEVLWVAPTVQGQDHSHVAVAVAVALGRPDQALDLTLGQVLAIATHFAVAASAKRDCP
jgi:hypothetical protein